MQERRRQPRRDLMSYSQVFNLDNGKLIGYLGDLTLAGAMVIGDDTMKVDTKLTISLQIPELPGSMSSGWLFQRAAHCQRPQPGILQHRSGV
jgi:hypothetical protein